MMMRLMTWMKSKRNQNKTIMLLNRTKTVTSRQLIKRMKKSHNSNLILWKAISNQLCSSKVGLYRARHLKAGSEKLSKIVWMVIYSIQILKTRTKKKNPKTLLFRKKIFLKM